MHREVWEHNNGKIPTGYHIHHKDKNKSNNDISNLELVEGKKHLSEHGKEWHKNNKEKSTQHIKEIVQKAKKWHKSKDGREWHKKHYENVKHKLHEKEIKKCKCCKQEFEGTKGNSNIYCSNKCKSKARRDSGIDNEIRICEKCKKEFETNKYSKVRFCSRKCAGGRPKKTNVLCNNK
ncbi:hypothetical protein MNB_SUP05-5-919 [hydrothermal vent metagenome]|uniref:HNH nuclease domain-containing protein n=1 Tax=hydrothermal vent metagenome TaxID=652676 RepID=A0A1W1C5K7_9ZZZZ